MTRTLGVDLGDVRIGLAISDPSGRVATPLGTVAPAGEEPEDVAGQLAGLAAEREAVRVVIGYPRTLEGREGRPATRARLIAEALREASDLDVELWDERFTTVEAERTMLEQGAKRRERRQAVDRVAATLLLQSFLDARRPKG